MKRILFIIFPILFLVPGIVFAQSDSLQIESLPSNMDEFLELRDEIAEDPMGGVMMFIYAMILYGQDEEMGRQAFTVALDKSEITAGDAFKGYQPSISWDYRFWQIAKFPFLGYIYIEGTTAAEGYLPQSLPYLIRFKEIRVLADDQVKLFLNTTSGNLPRPITVIKNSSGIWKVKEASSLFVGPSEMPPEEKPVDDL